MRNYQAQVVDFHTHILPQMDDGSNSVAMSLEMLEALQKQKATYLCATPHYYRTQETIAQFLQRRKMSFDRLSAEISSESLKIHLGAEVAFYSGISRCKELDELCLVGTRVLLLEMPISDWNACQVDEVISLALERNYQIVLAHPERFAHSTSFWNYMKKLTELPIALQINAESLLRWHTRKLALQLLQQTRRPLLGTDCHNLGLRGVRLEAARMVIQKKIGLNFLEHMDQTATELINIR